MNASLLYKWTSWRKGMLNICLRSCCNCCCLAVCLVVKSCLTLCDPMEFSPPGAPVHEIFQTRILECFAISSPGDLPNPGIKPASPALQADFYKISFVTIFFKFYIYCLSYLYWVSLKQLDLFPKLVSSSHPQKTSLHDHWHHLRLNMTSWRYPWPLTLSILYLIPMISIFSKYILFSPFLLLMTSFTWQLIIQYLLDGKQGIWPYICWDFNVGKLLVFLSWTIIIAHWLVICVLSAFRVILRNAY